MRFGALMRLGSSIGVALTCLLLSSLGWAQSGQCGFIKDPNLQAQCRAGSGGGSGQCGFIQDSDMQAYCRATTGGGGGQCGFIKDGDKQAICRAMTGSGPGQCGFIRDGDRQAYCLVLIHISEATRLRRTQYTGVCL